MMFQLMYEVNKICVFLPRHNLKWRGLAPHLEIPKCARSPDKSYISALDRRSLGAFER